MLLNSVSDCQNSFRSLLGSGNAGNPWHPLRRATRGQAISTQAAPAELCQHRGNLTATSEGAWLVEEQTLLVSLQVEKVLFLHCVKTPLCVRNVSKPGCFNLYPKFLCSPSKTIPSYMENREMGLCSLRGRSTGDPTAAHSSLMENYRDDGASPLSPADGKTPEGAAWEVWMGQEDELSSLESDGDLRQVTEVGVPKSHRCPDLMLVKNLLPVRVLQQRNFPDNISLIS